MEDAATTTTTARKQVVLYPSPGMGHLVSMIELGKIFAARGLAVTIVVVTLPYDTGAATGPFLDGVTAANPYISFDRLPPVKLPSVEYNHPEAVTFEVARVSNPHLRDFLAGASPSVLVVDFFCGIALDIAEEFRIPAYFFFTSGAGTLAFFLYLPVLHARSTASFQDMGEELVHVPGIPSIPATHAIKPLMDRDDEAYRGFLRVSADLCRSQGIIVNTFRSLEPRAIDTVTAGLCAPSGLQTPPVHCIGPLIKSEEVGVKRGEECLPWLDTQPKGSVVFLCFGSLGLFSAEQIREVANGLEASGQRFLWVVRSPPSDDPAKKFEKPPEPDLDALLPQGFLSRTEGTGLVVKSWAPQRDVLAHDAVGGFVTHCGWNSVLESVWAGVPMLCFPLLTDQFTNRRLVAREWRVGVPVGDRGAVFADEVRARIEGVMAGEEGEELRKAVKKVRATLEAAAAPGGSSQRSFDQFVDELTRRCGGR